MPSKRKRAAWPPAAEKTLHPPTRPLVADPKDVFGALAEWEALPDPAAVEMIVMVDFEAILQIFPPNPQLYSSVRTLEAGLGELNWHLNRPVLERAIESARWNEPLARLLEFASRAEKMLVVVHTGRNQDQNACVKAALAGLGIRPDMLAFRDPLQPSRTRKNQLVQRLWQFFSAASLSFYQGPHSRKETRDTRLLLQTLASFDRPLPQLFEVAHPAGYFEPAVERTLVEQLVAAASEQGQQLVCNITSPKWVWRVTNYRAVVEAVATLGDVVRIPEDITSYSGHSLDYSGSTTPQLEDRGRASSLTAHSISTSGTKVSLNFPGLSTVVANLNKRIEPQTRDTGPVEVHLALDVHRLISIKEDN